MIRTPLALLLFSLFATLPAAGRETPRETLAGKVLDRSEQPHPDAEVWLVHRPLGWTEELGRPDLVKVRSGADGSFVAEVLAGSPYSAWATWRDGNGQVHVTEVVEGAVAGRPITLLEPRLAFGARVTLGGLDRWQDRAPLRFRLRALIDTMWAAPFTLDARHTAALPVIPMGMSGDIEILAADGSILGFVSTLLSSRTDEPRKLEVDPPQSVSLRVLAEPNGEPIGGARVRRRPWSSVGRPYPGKPWGVVGESDLAGNCEIRIMASRHPLKYPDRLEESWLVSAPGYTDVLLGCHAGSFFTGTSSVSTPRVTITILMKKATPWRGRLLLADGRPAANVPVLVRAAWEVSGSPPAGEGVPQLLLPDYHLCTDVDGSFAAEGLPREVSALAAGLFLDSERCADLPPRNGDGFPTSPFLPFVEAAARPDEPGTIALADFERVRIQFRPPDGVGSYPLRVHVHEPEAKVPTAAAFAPELWTSREGRIGLWLRKGVTYDVLAWADEVGWVVHRLAVTARDKPITISLQPFTTMSGSVISKERKAIPEAEVRLVKEPSEVRFGIAAEIMAINRRLLFQWTDAKGCYEIRYIPHPGLPLRLMAKGRTRGSIKAPEWHSQPLLLTAAPRRDVVLVLDVPPEWMEGGKQGGKK